MVDAPLISLLTLLTLPTLLDGFVLDGSVLDGSTLVAAVLLAVGLACVAVALLALLAGSRVRRLYGVSDGDDASARRNSLALAATGLVLAATGVAVGIDLPDHAVAVGVTAAAGVLCVVLGWLVRYRDRRDLLTTPNVDRETGRRLGGVAIGSGLGCLALALAILADLPENVVVVFALVGGAALLVAAGLAYR